MLTTTMDKLRADVDEILPGVIADRRHFHEHPELGFQEFETAKLVAERLASLGTEDIRTGINKTGVTCLIRGSGNGPGKDRVVLLRADMDALPILEENEVDYVSRNPGVMHACGHDAHTAILLGVARILTDRKSEFAGTVKLLFQPAEEMPPGGALGMIEEGVLENPHVDAVFGLHMAQAIPVGFVGIRGGPVMAGGDLFEIIIQGKGGHAASPHKATDPIVIGSQIVATLQTVVSRSVDPMERAVVSITFFQAGDAFNVIPDSARLGGTVRWFDPGVTKLVEERIIAIATGIGEVSGAQVDVKFPRGYAPTINDDLHAEIVREAAIQVVGEDHVLTPPPVMGGEDFSRFLLKRPGAYFVVGSKNEEKGFVWGHHHPKFDIDEESLGISVATMTNTVFKWFARSADTLVP
ncbi:MAG: M20 metallopeptidase family protein [Thermomicrobiales bacterium]